MTSDFKVGDRVEWNYRHKSISPIGFHTCNGSIGVVSQVLDNGIYTVDFESGWESLGGNRKDVYVFGYSLTLAEIQYVPSQVGDLETDI